MGHYGGYPFRTLEDPGPGVVTAAFTHPEVALRWCLSCQAAMVDQDWPVELLEHELGEELRVWGWGPEERKDQRVLHRGMA